MRILVAVSLLVSLLALPAAAGEPANHDGGVAVPKLAWVACGDQAPGFQCATAGVPLDCDHPRRRPQHPVAVLRHHR
jgi:hypothetical protein